MRGRRYKRKGIVVLMPKEKNEARQYVLYVGDTRIGSMWATEIRRSCEHGEDLFVLLYDDDPIAILSGVRIEAC